jgi:neutral ceramidase
LATSERVQGRELTAGTARVVITPPVGIAMAGFAGRPPSVAVHDDLTATALVLAEGETGGGEGDGGGDGGGDGAGGVAIVALDLIGLREDAVASIKAQVQALTGIPPERVFLNCSHTHYGPAVGRERDGGDTAVARAYLEALVHHVAGVVAAAAAARRPVTLAAARGAVRVGINRRERREAPPAGPAAGAGPGGGTGAGSPTGGPGAGRIVLGQNPEGTLDSEVQVWRFDAAGDDVPEPGAPPGWVRRSAAPVAVLVNYACHGVSLGSTMRLMSADFVGVTRRVVEELVGGAALYVQGACGDINPSLMGPEWDLPRRLGNALGAEAARVALLAQPVRSLPLRVTREHIDLPALMPASLEEGRARVAALEAERERLDANNVPPGAGARSWNTRRLERVRQGLAALERGEVLPPVGAEIGALRIGEAALVTNPSELFCEIGMTIKRESPFPWTAVAGYTDGSAGYIPTRAAYPEGGYEVDSACRVNPGAGDMVEATSLRLLRSLA